MNLKISTATERSESQVELFREATIMVLYVAVVEIAELAALPERRLGHGEITGPVGSDLLAIVWGTALSLAFLWFAVYAAVSLLGGAVYLFGRFPKPETPAQTPAEVTCGSLGGDSDQG